MIPDFALSLSADGIALLFRAADGWRSVAETPFDAEDLTPALAAMREDALRLAPDGIHCKLILPNDQIRYLTVETGDLPAEERLAAARQALQGATPYAVDELAFDISAEGGSTHIAAVALETLDEAESFAVEHGFAPVGFVAVPGDSGFQGEPFFGTTRAFRGTGMAAGSAPVTVIGPVEFPEPAAEVPAALDAAEALPVEPEAAAELPPEFVAGELTGELTEAEALDEPQESAPDTDAPVKIPPAPPSAAAETETGTDIAPPDSAGFSSRRSKSAPAAAKLAAPGRDPSPMPVAAAPQPAPAAAAAKPLGAANAGLAPDTGAPAAPRPAIPPAPAALRQQAPAAEAAQQAVAAGSTAAGKSRYPGLVLTALLLLFLATAAVWALFGEDGFFAASPVEDQGLSDVPPAGTGGDGAEPAVQPDATAVREAPGEAEDIPAIAPQVSVLADQPDPSLPDTGAAADGETGLADAGAAAPDPSVADEAAADGAELPDDGTETAFLDPDSLQPGAAGDAVLEPAEPVIEEPLDALAQAARYAATGIWPIAPEVNSSPAAPDLEALYTASIDRNGAAPDAVALPHPESFAQDEEPGAIASPAAAGAAFDLDARGLVKATPEGTLNPDGIMIYLGRPEVVPLRAPERSDQAAEALAEEVARNQVLSRKRPKARPADLEEQAERAQLGGLSRAELASLRPRMRPASLKPAEEEQLPATAQAVAASVVPRGRPANFANLVDRARRNTQNQVQTAAAVPAAAAAAAPRIPTAASVARRATVGGALNLRKLNLIGVYGTASERRALVRLPSGRYKKVQVGDRIDGGRVIAIGESQLQYQKSGRNRTLAMPNG